MSESLPIGATTVGLVFADGVVLAADKRVSYGYTLMSKSGKKVFALNRKIGMSCAGLMGDMQGLAKSLTAEIKIYELQNNRSISVKGAAKLLANILYSAKMLPYYTEILIGGVDDTGPHLYVMDPIGSILEDYYAGLGNGSPVSTGVLDQQYKSGMSREEAEALAVRAIRAAIARDITTGDGVDVMVITDTVMETRQYPVKEQAAP
ncbi:MAG: archaeal proteasome endopeptidase complex subunit beta [Thermoprotei archaeon]